MSAISSAYDNLLTVVQAALPSHKELINPYVPEMNDELTYESAWGVAFQEGLNTNRVVGCEISIRRTMLVTICRKIFAGTLNRTSDSITRRRTAEKALFEDLYQVINDLEHSPTTNNSNPIIKTVYQADSGLEFVRTERHDLIMVRASFELEYFEHLVP